MAHIDTSLFNDFESYLATEYSDERPYFIVGSHQGAGESALNDRLLAEPSLQTLENQEPLASMPAAVLVVDAHQGITVADRRHCVLLSLMGLRRIAVAINKMDVVSYSQARFDEIVREFRAFAKQLLLPKIAFIPVSALQGDNVHHGLNRDLGFTDVDRVENIRRVAEVARLMLDAGLIVMSAFISPFRDERQLARDLLEDGEFLEVFVDAPLEIAEHRDPKGLYKKARRGDLKNFTGIDSAYEAPQAPELTLNTAATSPEEAAEQVIQLLIERNVVK